MRHKPSPFRKDSPRDPERDGGDESLKEAPPPPPHTHQLRPRQGRNGFFLELSGKHTSKPQRAGVRGGGEREGTWQ